VRFIPFIKGEAVRFWFGQDGVAGYASGFTGETMTTKRANKKALISHVPASLSREPKGYRAWIADVKTRIRAAQMRATLAVNHELISLYWSIGRDILDRQQKAGWGAGIVDRVSADLRAAFPDMRGFSRANLMYMRAFAEAWPDINEIVQQPVGQLGQQLVGQLPWGHNLVLLTKLKSRDTRLAYAARAVEHGWSRAVLTLHIEQGTVERTGKAITNFTERLPKPLSDLARESMKDPYRFDFLSLGAEAGEREIEDALVTHISRFLIELGHRRVSARAGAPEAARGELAEHRTDRGGIRRAEVARKTNSQARSLTACDRVQKFGREESGCWMR